LVVGTTTVTVTADAAATSTGSAITASAEVVVVCNPATTICTFDWGGRRFSVPPTVIGMARVGAHGLVAAVSDYGLQGGLPLYSRWLDGIHGTDFIQDDPEQLGLTESDLTAAVVAIGPTTTTAQAFAQADEYCNSLNEVYLDGRSTWRTVSVSDIFPYNQALNEANFLPAGIGNPGGASFEQDSIFVSNMFIDNSEDVYRYKCSETYVPELQHDESIYPNSDLCRFQVGRRYSDDGLSVKEDFWSLNRWTFISPHTQSGGALWRDETEPFLMVCVSD
ncbi:TPA: hypothetical protein RUX41_004260, partial [Aeromonas dhakensis]|nr:hypothetical protein [Aeromonas dhakensis]